MDYEAIWNEAQAAGHAAGTACRPVPMTVAQHENGLDDRSPVVYAETVLDGVCGFAWVKIRPANCGMARWLKKQSLGHLSHTGGWEVGVRGYDQSMQRKYAHARAAADVLKKYGIKASAYDRLD